MDEAEFNTEKEPHGCMICEKVTTGTIRFTECGDLKLAVCIECIAIGIRWIVMKAKEERAKEEGAT